MLHLESYFVDKRKWDQKQFTKIFKQDFKVKEITCCNLYKTIQVFFFFFLVMGDLQICQLKIFE